jgi:hypothetical protein
MEFGWSVGRSVSCKMYPRFICCGSPLRTICMSDDISNNQRFDAVISRNYH